MAADLHCHTRHSDGSATVEEVILFAKGNGISTLAITDHDTVSGWEEAAWYGERYGVTVIPGIELSGYDNKREQKAHILCYFCPQPERLAELCGRIAKDRRQATEQMIQTLLECYPITKEMIVRRAGEGRSIYKQHILHTLMDAGYTKEIFGSLYQKLFDHQEGLAHIEIPYPDVYQVLETIREAGGVAVMAHPGECKKEGLLEELAASGLLDGVEIWHPKNSLEKRPGFQATAQQYGLIMTGGTDFHGMYSSHCDPVGSYTTPEDQLRALYRRKEEKGPFSPRKRNRT